MIQKINIANKNISFCSSVQHANPIANNCEDNDAFTREYIRNNIEENLGIAYKYADTIGTMSYSDAIRYYSSWTKTKVLKPTKKEATKVNEGLLKQLGYSYYNVKRPNEIYAGARLSSKSNGIETAKSAGIKTILSLENMIDDFYGEPAREAGLNFIALDEIGNKTLKVFDIIPTPHNRSPKVISKLIDNPQIWQTQSENGTKKAKIDRNIEDVQSFIDILNGKNKNYPLPIYYGCQWGTERTYAWETFYNILKDAPRTKPLDKEKIERLENLRDIMAESYY